MSGTVTKSPAPASVAAGALLLIAFVGAGGAILAHGKDARRTPTVSTVGHDKDHYHDHGGGAYLGVQIREETALAGGGARVTEVVPDSPADEAGLREGDVIVQIDGDAVRGPAELTKRIRSREPGDRVKVGVVRDGKRTTLDAELGERDSYSWHVPIPVPDSEYLEELAERSREWAGQYQKWQEEHGREWADKMEQWQREWQEEHGEEWAERYREWAEQYGEQSKEWAERYKDWAREYADRMKDGEWFLPRAYVGRASRPKLGVELVDTTPELRQHLGGSEDAGVLVGKVLSGTAAERAGVRVGDLILSVDGKSVRTPSDLVRELADKDGRTIALEIVRDGRKRKLEARIPEAEDELFDGPRASLAPPAPLPPQIPSLAPPPLPSSPPPPELPALAPAPPLPAPRHAARLVRAEIRDALRQFRDARRTSAREIREGLREALRQQRDAQRDRARAQRDVERRIRDEIRRSLRESRVI